jgi:hypothetical protein
VKYYGKHETKNNNIFFEYFWFFNILIFNILLFISFLSTKNLRSYRYP